MIAGVLLHVFKLRMTGDRCLDFTTPQGLHCPVWLATSATNVPLEPMTVQACALAVGEARQGEATW